MAEQITWPSIDSMMTKFCDGTIPGARVVTFPYHEKFLLDLLDPTGELRNAPKMNPCEFTFHVIDDVGPMPEWTQQDAPV